MLVHIQPDMAHERATLAATAARIIDIESELTDWALARRKATAGKESPHGTPQPSDAEIIADSPAGRRCMAAGGVCPLRAQREYALEADAGLAAFNPALVGPVAEGWRMPAAEIRIG